jgi:RNA polymerase sigma factor (TIGR02999 family)
MAPPTSDVTVLLQRYSSGDQDALAELAPLIYEELHHLASYYRRRERRDHTLQTTALVHEAYLRLVDQKQAHWKSKGHFLSVAAQMMRRILVDYARRHRAAKRGGPLPKLSLHESLAFSEAQSESLLLLDRLLDRLAAMDPLDARIIELRFFGGLSVAETAEAMGISPTTVKREWSVAKKWLAREMGKGTAPASARAKGAETPPSRG